MLAMQKLFFQMHWSFLIAPTGSEGFLTSDNPVSVFDPAAGPNEGAGFLGNPAAYFTFPIGREICLLAQFQPKALPAHVTDSDVRRTNKGTITRADSQLYAPFQSDRVRQLFDHVSEQKKRSRRILLKRGHVVEE